MCACHRRFPARCRSALPVLILLAVTACARPTTHFSESNARAHVNMLAGTIGSRAAGTSANQRARAYVIDQLRNSGFDVRIQLADAERPEFGVTARVANIIASRRGSRADAIALVAHYDSADSSPGGTDDAFGVAVALEAARVLGARPRPNHALMVLLTDAEEAGLLGAAALVKDPEVAGRVKAYANLDAIGSSGTAVLFEAGPGNGWLLRPWAIDAPHPQGSSYAVEIYKRLPNDTDFTMLKRLGVPGLNFAPIGDSYAYHTARDTAERLSPQTLRTSGANVVAFLQGADHLDLSRRTAEPAIYFDVARARGVTYSPATGRLIAILALILGIVAWLRYAVAAVRIDGIARALVTVVWIVLTGILVTAAMVGVVWALRAARESYQPWYAYPDRLFGLLLIVALATIWLMSWGAGALPARVRGTPHPARAWAAALPVWMALAAAAEWYAPAASYLWTLPLLTAGIALIVPPTHRLLVAIASLVTLAVTATLWVPDLVELLRFTVTVFGRLRAITPVFVYPALLATVALMIAPPLAGVLMIQRAPLIPRKLLTATLLASLALSAWTTYRAPAYTYERPLRRDVRYIHDGSTARAIWEVGSNEPGIDLIGQPPLKWQLVRDAPRMSVPVVFLGSPFVFRAEASPDTVPPGSAVARILDKGSEVDLEVAVSVSEPGASIGFVFPTPPGPLRSNIAGVVRPTGEWRATYVAPPPDGFAFRASFPAGSAAPVRRGAVLFRTAGLPGGTGWQRLPPWLPQDRATWAATALYIVPIHALVQPAGDLEPTGPLR